MTDQPISTTVDNETARRFKRYMSWKDLNQSQAARKLMEKGLRDWEALYGPYRSLLLYLSIAATAWAAIFVAGYSLFRTPSFVVSGMTIYLALLSWTAYVIIVLRQYWDKNGVRVAISTSE